MILLKVLKKSIILFINLFVLLLSLFVKKTDKVVVVGGWFGQRFADNSKYLYLYLNENKDIFEIDKVIWITKSKIVEKELLENNFEVYSNWSIKSMWYHLRAKYHFIDQAPNDINSFFSVRSKRINLWHGFPLKKIGTYMKNNGDKNSENGINFLKKITVRGFWSDHYLLATSDFTSKILSRAFDISLNNVIISGYPRNYEPLLKNPIQFIPKNEEKYYYEIKSYKDNGYKVIFYLPTFRDNSETFIFGSKDNNELHDFFDFCEKNKIKIIGKFHFAGKNDKVGDIKNHQAFLNLPSNTDVYTFLNFVDLLITDYSSIYYDFLLWKKPVIFLPYDLEYYRDEDRGFIYDYERYTPGEKVRNCNELKELLSEGIEKYSKKYFHLYSDKMEEVSRIIFSDYEKNMLEDLMSKVKEL